MGEIAEMTLEGVLCEGCGVYLGDSVGYPRRCPNCNKTVEEEPVKENLTKRQLKRKRYLKNKRACKVKNKTKQN